MADHSDFLLMAQELIADDGRLVTFAKLDATAADASKPWKGAGTPTLTGQVSTFAIFVFLSSLTKLGRHVTDSELFKAADQILLVAPPTTGEVLLDYNLMIDSDSTSWRITVIDELKPADLTLLYAMGVRR